MASTDSARPSPDDLAWVSWLRFVAIAAVVTIHTMSYNALAPDARDTLRGTVAIYLDVGSVFAVPVFVMLSGAFTLDPARYEGARDFLRKRAVRLLPAILFWHLWYFAIRRYVEHADLGLSKAAAQAIDGTLYGALYFFWIVLGLAVITPILIPFIAQASRKQVLIASAGFLLMTATSRATMDWRGAPDLFVENAWTWWVPYLGYFLLGWGLRGIVLRGWPLFACLAAVVGLAAFMPWHWHNPAAPAWIDQVSPAWYYSITVMIYSAAIYLLFQGVVRRGGLLDVLATPRAKRIGRLLGDATLGVFALHLTILKWAFHWPVVGGNAAADGTTILLTRIAAVLVVTYALVLVLRRIPGIRQLL